MLAAPRAVFCVVAIVAAFGVAHAEGTACTSITQSDCPPLPRVTAKGNLRVEVLGRKRSVSFQLRAGDEQYEELLPVCPGGKCGCYEDVQHLDFKGLVPAFRQINAFEMRAAAAAKCSLENSNLMRQVVRFAVSKHFVSTAIFELEYCRTCGGSCHGHTVIATYDAKTGKAVLGRDVLRAERLGALRSYLADYFAKTYMDEPQREAQKANLLDVLSARTFADESVYVENGVLYVNLDMFALSCADGSFFPIPAPAEFIAPAFAALIEP